MPHIEVEKRRLLAVDHHLLDFIASTRVGREVFGLIPDPLKTIPPVFRRVGIESSDVHIHREGFSIAIPIVADLLFDLLDELLFEHLAIPEVVVIPVPVPAFCIDRCDVERLLFDIRRPQSIIDVNAAIERRTRLHGKPLPGQPERRDRFRTKLQRFLNKIITQSISVAFGNQLPLNCIL